MKISTWIEATRPKTLAAGIVPVLIGSSVSYYHNNFNFIIFFITLLCSVLIQILTNYYNEIYDFKKGADDNSRVGPKRQVASGEISVKKMYIVTNSLLVLTFCLGLVLVEHSSYLILLIGLLSLLFAFLYTGGPYPLAYNALGDIFVFIFFGIIAVNGTYYVQTGNFSNLAMISSIPPGLLSANILNVNNIRDINTDFKVGKITLSYKIGKDNSILMYRISTIISFIIPVYLYIYFGSYLALLPFLSIPLAIKLMIDIKKKQGNELNKILSMTGALLFIFGIFFSLSIILLK